LTRACRWSRLIKGCNRNIHACRALPVALVLSMIAVVFGACAAPPPPTALSSLAVTGRPAGSEWPARPAVPLDGVPLAAEAAAPAAVIPLAAAPSPLSPLVEPGSDLAVDEFFVHVPPVIDGVLEVLVVLHGMEGNGPAFARPLLAQTDRQGWVVVAPTYPYGNWQDPAQLVREETGGFIPRLSEFLDGLSARTGLALAPREAP
jgi:hypothetical protein